MPKQVRRQLSNKYKCTKCGLSSSPLLICPSLHKICAKCYDLFTSPSLICPICKLDFTSTDEFTEEYNEAPLPVRKMSNTNKSDSLIDDLLSSLPESMNSNGDMIVPYHGGRISRNSYSSGYGPSEETTNRQIRRQCFLALWDTATTVFGNSSRKGKSKGPDSPAQLFCRFIMNSFVRKMGRPVFLLLEEQNKYPGSRRPNNRLYIAGGFVALLVIVGYWVKSSK